jgi:hypothetical protein
LTQEFASINGRERLYCFAGTYRSIHPNQCNCTILVRFKNQIMPKNNWLSRAVKGRHSDIPAVTHWGHPSMHGSRNQKRSKNDAGSGSKADQSRRPPWQG